MNTDLNNEKPRIAISACLLGQKVRYDGQGKAHDWLLRVLAPYVEWFPVCPEVEMGLGVPRETLRLVYGESQDEVRLLAPASGRDLTVLAREVSHKAAVRLQGVDGIILKKSSPSCGLERVKIYSEKGIPQAMGRGFFADAINRLYPSLPCIEEGRLVDIKQREQFLTQIFALAHLRSKVQSHLQEGATSREFSRKLQSFHQTYKFLLLSHHPEAYRVLGRLAAHSKEMGITEVFRQYSEVLASALSVTSTPGKRVNALQHIFGYFKKFLSRAEKEHIGSLLEQYRCGIKPFSAIIALIESLCHRFDQDYILQQVILNPFPMNLNQS